MTTMTVTTGLMIIHQCEIKFLRMDSNAAHYFTPILQPNIPEYEKILHSPSLWCFGPDTVKPN